LAFISNKWLGISAFRRHLGRVLQKTQQFNLKLTSPVDRVIFPYKLKHRRSTITRRKGRDGGRL